MDRTTSGRAVRFGLLGCADIAARRTLPALAEVDQARLVAVSSRDAAKAADFAKRFDAIAVTGYQRLLDSTDIDAVYIPLPPALHAEWVEKALHAGRHVLVEKPLSTDPATTARLLRLAEERGLVLMENSMYLRHSQHAAVRDLIAEGAIGEVRGFESTFAVPPRPESDIRHVRELGGGALLDVGVYPLGAALHFLGPELELVGAVLRHDRRRDVDLSGSALLTTATGTQVRLGFGLENSYRSHYGVAGSTGRMDLERAFTPHQTHRPVIVLDRSGDREKIILPAAHQFRAMIVEFADVVRSGRRPITSATRSRQLAGLMAEIDHRAKRVYH
ncbi:Gfo/Idh/MocA family protein [Saccharomonospora xinjiangensis]|uniref:Gfo/Idh/MocA family protein n=1 Tax=Saccharomonospora xinjiangensis TaxID=75294 RepID=UPI00350E92FE